MSWRDLTARLLGPGADDAVTADAPPADPDLQRTLDDVAAEYSVGTTMLLVARLRMLVNRQVPVGHLAPAPVVGTARMVFADGTALLVRGAELGELGRLAVAIAMHHRAFVAAYRPDPAGCRIIVQVGDRQTMVDAIGLDQAD